MRVQIITQKPFRLWKLEMKLTVLAAQQSNKRDIFMIPSRQLKKHDKRESSDRAISSNKQEGKALI